MPTPSDAGRRALADRPTCPWCGSVDQTAEWLHDGNRLSEDDLVDAMIRVFLDPGGTTIKIAPSSFPEVYGPSARFRIREKMRAALGTAIRQMPYLGAVRADPDRAAGEREAAERMRERCLEVVRYTRKNYRPILNKSRYQAHEIQIFFGGACGLIEEDICALALDPAAGQEKRQGEGDGR